MVKLSDYTWPGKAKRIESTTSISEMSFVTNHLPPSEPVKNNDEVVVDKFVHQKKNQCKLILF